VRYQRHVPAFESASKLGFAYLFDGRFTVDVYSHVPGVTDEEVIALAHRLAANEKLLAACELWDKGFVEGEQFTPEQFRVWVNNNRRAAREAIAATKPT
jgi:hypothetical protein